MIACLYFEEKKKESHFVKGDIYVRQKRGVTIYVPESDA